MRVIFIFFIFFSLSINAQVFPIPEDKEVNFDVLRKNKVIGKRIRRIYDMIVLSFSI